MNAFTEAFPQNATSYTAQTPCKNIDKRESRTAPIVWVLWLLVLALAPIDARAELFGLPGGRLADISRQSPMSVEAGFIKGEFLERDYSQPSVRMNYRIANDLMLFALRHSLIGCSFAELQNVEQCGRTGLVNQ